MSQPNNQQLKNIRHSSEHLLTMAMHQLYGQNQIVMAMGPATDEGFYFDFDQIEKSQGKKFQGEQDFPKIEKQIKKLIAQKLIFTRLEVEPALASKVFADNPYKQEWIAQAREAGETISLYVTTQNGKLDQAKELIAQGENPFKHDSMIFVDLCKGPHVESTQEIGAIKLLNVAGAYWHGDENNQMLTRIYGTAFAAQSELDEYLHWREEAQKRDHRRLGKELDLFTFSELVGPGLPLWTPKGTLLRNLLDDYVWQLRQQKGYQKVAIPHITKKDLYETSGHWAKYADDLFKIKTREDHEFAMKPMNCPHHTQIYAHQPRSYRDLPQRYAETTMVYRDEQTGELSGLSRVRCITQDDAHVFCRESQVENESLAIWDIIEQFYQAVGFDNLQIRLSLHDPDNFDNYLGSKEDWLTAENQLRQLIESRGAQYVEALGEAAFYGPKIDFMARDSLNREWQVATIQIDRNMPERFDLTCINENSEKERVVMIHAAIMGSIERFMSILIEHFAGAFPLWLAPTQVCVVPIADDQLEYAQQVAKQLEQAGLRVEISSESETMQNRIRKAEAQKIPYMLIIGQREIEQNQVAVRQRGQKDLGRMTLNDFIEQTVNQVKQKQI